MSKLTGCVSPAGDKAYFFCGAEYLRYDVASDGADAGYPLPIVENWPGLFESDIDAAVPWPDGSVYFFREDEYIKYDWASDQAADGYPKPISDGWPGLFESQIDAAVLWSSGNAYFFRGDQYIKWDMTADRAAEGYPVPISQNWPGLFESSIGAALMWPSGDAYFFKELEYAKYDPAADRVADGYPKPIQDNWPGLRLSRTATGLQFQGATDAVTTGTQPIGQGDTAVSEPETTDFLFTIQPGEDVRTRIVRCCSEALADGQMGQFDRHDFYRSFISCGIEPTPEKAEALTRVSTSCAMFVRAVLHWSGLRARGPYVPGTGMFTSMGKVSLGHRSFVKHDGTNQPQTGDYFFIANRADGIDGHTGIFVEDLRDGRWKTAEGGGGGSTDGTLCRFTERQFSGTTFANDARRVVGWFDCTQVGIPA
jgi:hypothetical protein